MTALHDRGEIVDDLSLESCHEAHDDFKISGIDPVPKVSTEELYQKVEPEVNKHIPNRPILPDESKEDNAH